MSKFSPKYLTVWLYGVQGIVLLLICSGVGVANVLRENILAVDFDGLSLIFHFRDQSSMFFRCI